jgi:energy-converting hydrogenase Eha subunit C
VRTKARIQGGMASIVEWQSLKVQDYRYHLLIAVHKLWELFGVRRPISIGPPPQAGDYDHALHVDHPEMPSILLEYMEKAERDLVAQPKLSSRSSKKRRKKHLEYDRFTLYSLVVVGIIFTVALNHYLWDVHVALGVHILAVAAPMILLGLYVVLLRPKRNYAKDKGASRIPAKVTGD